MTALATESLRLSGCASHKPSSAWSLSELPDIRQGHYKVEPYIQAAISLQAADRATALERLHAMAQERESQAKAIVLCRMLFSQRPGSEFRRPRIGAAAFLGGTDYDDWPLEPIALVDGVPFLVISGYMLGGFPEPVESYLRYCEANCDWSSLHYTLKTEEQKRSALEKLLSSTKWKTPLGAFEHNFFAEQLQ